MNKQFVSPFLFPLVALITGIFWHYYIPYTIVTFYITFFLLAVLTIYLKLHKHSFLFTMTFFFFGGAYLLYAQQKERYTILEQFNKRTFDAQATVIDEEVKDNCPYKYVLKLAINAIKIKETKQFIPQNFNLLIYCQKKPQIQVGDHIIFYNIQFNTKKEKTTLTNAPTIDEYLTKENVLAVVFSPDPTFDLTLRPSFSYTRYLTQKRNAICQHLKTKLSRKTYTLFASIFLGTKTFKTIDDTKEAFGFWGLAHYLARSGLHIVLLIFAWSLLLNLIPIPFWHKRMLLLLITLLYTALSWSSISFMRTIGVFIIYEIGRIWIQQLNFLHILTLVCMIILITNPLQLIFLDFQLSFALTFALVLSPLLFYKKIEPNQQKP